MEYRETTLEDLIRESGDSTLTIDSEDGSVRDSTGLRYEDDKGNHWEEESD